MTHFRTMLPHDIEPVAEFAMAGMGVQAHPALRLSREKVGALVRFFTQPGSGFHLVAFDGATGRVVGAIAACVSEMLTFERCEAHVVMCQARGGESGVGRFLIAALREWADSNMMVRRVQFPEEFGARPGFARLLRRYGFSRIQRVCIYEKE